MVKMAGDGAAAWLWCWQLLLAPQAASAARLPHPTCWSPDRRHMASALLLTIEEEEDNEPYCFRKALHHSF